MQNTDRTEPALRVSRRDVEHWSTSPYSDKSTKLLTLDLIDCRNLIGEMISCMEHSGRYGVDSACGCSDCTEFRNTLEKARRFV
jgi:hypothetical protein